MPKFAACPLDGIHLTADAAAKHVQNKHSHLTHHETFHLISWLREQAADRRGTP